MCSYRVSLLRSFCRLPCVRRAAKRRCEGGSSGPSPPAARLSSITSAWLLSLLSLRRSTFPGLSWGEPGLVSRGADRLFSVGLWGSFSGLRLDGQPRSDSREGAWMSRRSEPRRWSCCCFASPCGYCDTIQLRRTPSFTSVRIRLKQARKAAPTRFRSMIAGCSAAPLHPCQFGAFGGRCSESDSLSNTLESCLFPCVLLRRRRGQRRNNRGWHTSWSASG